MKKDVWYGGKTWKNVWDKTRNYTYLRASGITTLLTLSYGAGTPSNALSRSSAAAPLLVLWGIILSKLNVVSYTTSLVIKIIGTAN